MPGTALELTLFKVERNFLAKENSTPSSFLLEQLDIFKRQTYNGTGLKDQLREIYDHCIDEGPRTNTKGGNMRGLSLKQVVQ